MSTLNLWTVYYSPRDFPNLYVARRFELERATSDVHTAHTLGELRQQLPLGLHRLVRAFEDDPCIVEVWF